MNILRQSVSRVSSRLYRGSPFMGSPLMMMASYNSSRANTFATQTPSATPPSNDPVQKKIAEDVKRSACVIYMKGTPEQPMCGFSNAVVRVLNAEDARYASYNVLEDSGIREGIKAYTGWPTIPQVFIKGEFIGGADITVEMYKSGELGKKLEEAGAKPASNNTNTTNTTTNKKE
eukprot:TRINITY_DN1327_c0_g1_i1.p1 TRINITY_DN1327_c0_g1~~TRINITY_DN1327_c0_g1_i1.p1  ORF type:complete len:175 (-),score=54.42 TRINITY_DN1327_c0_g1_i1:218-742(-)